MALPVVKTLAECASYANTVAPYNYQLKPLTKVYYESITSPAGLLQIYIDTNPLVTALAFSIALAPIFLVVSEINKNYSQVDRFWSILPSVYAVHYGIYGYVAGLQSQRNTAVSIIAIIWSCRLSYNYWRKGGYSIGSEDYRWKIVKDYLGSFVFFLFNITFISLLQSLLLFSVTMPAYVLLLTSRLASTSSSTPAWDYKDTVASVTMMSFITIAAISDQQQWNYYKAREEYRSTARVPVGYHQVDLERGFNTTGIYRFSRHANFAAEQSVWCTLYLWSCAATNTYFNWTAVGALCYVWLFQGSTWLTELLSAGKYPEYKEYQQQVGKFYPSFRDGPLKFSGIKQNLQKNNKKV